jgi:DNA replication protein DnaC
MATKSVPVRLLSNDRRVAGLPGTPAPVLCEFCGKERYTEGTSLFDDGRIHWFPGGANPCSCPEAQAWRAREQEKLRAQKKAEEERKVREQLQGIILNSGMGERLRQRLFRNFEADTPDRKKTVAAARAYAQNFDRHLPKPGAPVFGFNGLLITGTKGTGKTHIAAAIANYLLSKGTAAICMTERNLFGQIQKTYSLGRENGMSEADVRGIYESIPLLVIDDMGKEKPSEWTLATLYAVIDGRYNKAMPLIVTTNYDMQSLVKRLTPKDGDKITAEAIVDRLSETCESIVMTGDSWRSRGRD